MSVPIKRIIAVFLRQFFVVKGSATRLFIILYWPILELFLWGVFTVYLHDKGGSEFNFVTVLLGTILLAEMMGRAQYGVAVSALEDVWVRNFINLFASPLTLAEYLGGLVLMSVVVVCISLAGMSIFVWLLFAYNIFQFGLFLIPFMAVLFIFGVAIGLLSLALIIRFGPSAETLTWALPAFFGPFSGVFYPVTALPEFLQWFAKLLPPSYIFEGMRSIIFTGTFDVRSLLAAFILVIAYLILAYFMLLRYYKLALKRGLFIKFHAEDF